MAKYPINNPGLGVSLTTVGATQLHPLGYIVAGYDDTIGAGGEFMYVKFNATTADAEIVYIDLTNECVLADSDLHANDGGPVGWALAAAAADDYGWVQIAGKVKAKAVAAAAAGAKVFLTATGGTVDDAAIAGCQVLSAEFDTTEDAPADGYAYITCNRPNVQGQIT